MGVLEDLRQFLSTRLEEFIRSNPQLELQILDDQLEHQENEVAQLLTSYSQQQQQLQDQILKIAEDIKLWHDRAHKAQQAGMTDLAQGAKEREATLLKQGNQIWAQMELVKQRRQQTQDLQTQIKTRRQELQIKIAENRKQQTQTAYNYNWQNLHPPTPQDDLEMKFRKWETEAELERLKRKMGK
jgi:uncharacterized protein (TIGR04376 family)